MEKEKKKVLIVIDMQNDFVYGPLGTPEAQAIVPNVVKKVEEYKKDNSIIISTQDTHFANYLETKEGQNLPVNHCIVNSDGWQIEDSVYNSLRMYDNYKPILKHTFGSLEIIEYLKSFISEEKEIQNNYSIEICGLCLDICVISNLALLKTTFPETNIFIDLKCTAATTLEKYKDTVSILESLQIEVINE